MAISLQLGFADYEQTYAKKKTRRQIFLEEMEATIPWDDFHALIRPVYHQPSAKGGWPPFPLEVMLRIHLLQQWFTLSDPLMEEMLIDTPCFRRFAGIDLIDGRIPDESTILNFRHLLEEHQIAEQVPKAAAILKKRWSREFFIEEAYIPFGTARISDRRAYPDILRIFPDGTIGLVELKRWGGSDLEKWKILGELQFYTFLIETQYKQDYDDYHWMFGMIRRGLLCQATIDALEDRIRRELPLVRAWAILIIGGERDVIEQDERIWHLYDHVNLSLEQNSEYRPMSLLHYSERLEEDSVDELHSWYSRPDED